DGKEVSTKVTGGALPDNTGTQPLRIGANSLEEDKFFNGAVDEIRVWNRGLSDEEIKQVYSNNTNNTEVKDGQVLHLDFSTTNVTEAATMGGSVTEAATVGPSFKDATKYKVVKVWGGAGTEDGKFLRPHDLDFNNDESILYAIDRDGGRVQAFDKEGNFLFKFGKNGQADGEFSVPYGLDVDKEGNLWVADRANHRVQKFDSHGNFILKIGSNDFTKSTEPGKFDNPRHVRVDHENKYVYVADSKNNRIQQFDMNGKFIKVIGKLGDKPGEFNLITTIEIDPEGNFFTTERGNERIQKFDKDWKPILMWGSKGSGDSQFCHMEHIAIDKYGNVYVNDPQSDPGCSQIPVVKKFDNNGKFITKWGSLGKEPGQFGDPEHMAIDSEGNVYISDRKNDNIQKFAPIP
ncbi:MAG TPA: 6-bladed beta-propeller, partial [Nitrososphaeraceae archaeon]|nr:6-bladed beta-propeller [Nitrososphaeraceae archaeon]